MSAPRTPGSPSARSVSVGLGSRSYEILVGAGVLGDAASFEALPEAAAAAIVTNVTIAPLYAKRLEDRLAPLYPRVHRIVLPDGESHKTWNELQAVFDALLEARCGRDTLVFALGGGVVGDMAGFAAACFMRGVPYVQVPTTLLAQVDSSVGGKTAVNHALGKNMIGAFHQPARVVADVETLDTLPQREFVAGLAEVIKAGVVADAEFLHWIETELPALLRRDRAATVHAVVRACEIKAAIVGEDERETGRRAVLNFGHTFGHAIETGLGHGTWLHGEAVGCGMVMAADLSARMGRIDAAEAARVERIVSAAGLPVRAPAWSAARYLELMSVDKKARSGQTRFVLLDDAGGASLVAADPACLEQTLRNLSLSP